MKLLKKISKLIAILSCLGLMAFIYVSPKEKLEAHVDALKSQGSDPVYFVIDKLKKHDLIIFDDALHNMEDPFDFYETLIRDKGFQEAQPIIFLELLPINKQKHIDAYLEAEEEDETLLYPTFHDRTGYNMKSYFDLLRAIYDINKTLPNDKKFQVRGVNTPVYWEAIKDKDDLMVAERRAPLGRDFDMYMWILDDLEYFEGDKKGIFLTNTRHAYKALRDKENKLFWNTGTFFHEWHPGKTYSIRFNAPFLKVERVVEANGENLSTDGTDRMQFVWRRADGGVWDTAFERAGGEPVAISLNDTVFGRAPYLGNRTHTAAPGQTMQDVYDAVIYLKPMEELQKTALIGGLYTPSFKKELARRLPIMFSQSRLDSMMSNNGLTTLEELVDFFAIPEDASPLPQSKVLDDIDSFLKPQ